MTNAVKRLVARIGYTGRFLMFRAKSTNVSAKTSGSQRGQYRRPASGELVLGVTEGVRGVVGKSNPVLEHQDLL